MLYRLVLQASRTSSDSHVWKNSPGCYARAESLALLWGIKSQNPAELDGLHMACRELWK